MNFEFEPDRIFTYFLALNLEDEPEITTRPYTARVSARARRRVRGTPRQQTLLLSRIFAQAFGGVQRGTDAEARIRFGKIL